LCKVQECRLHGVLVSHLTSLPSELGGGEGEAMVAGSEGCAGASPVMLCRRRGPGGVDPTVSCFGDCKWSMEWSGCWRWSGRGGGAGSTAAAVLVGLSASTLLLVAFAPLRRVCGGAAAVLRVATSKGAASRQATAAACSWEREPGGDCGGCGPAAFSGKYGQIKLD
jgi:hypothetical protein